MTKKEPELSFPRMCESLSLINLVIADSWFAVIFLSNIIEATNNYFVWYCRHRCQSIGLGKHIVCYMKLYDNFAQIYQSEIANLGNR